MQGMELGVPEDRALSPAQDGDPPIGQLEEHNVSQGPEVGSGAPPVSE